VNLNPHYRHRHSDITLDIRPRFGYI
jgi:hypothetical protein